MAKTKIHGEYLDPSVISGQTQVTAVGADSMLVFDATDNALKKALLSDLIETVGSTPTFTSATISGDLTVDTTTLKVDSSNNRVGIGTSSPTGILEIAGDASSNNQFLRLSNTESSHVRNWVISPVGSSSGALRIFDVTANSERMRIDSSGMLGLGTTPPSDSHATWSQFFIGQKGSVISERLGSGGLFGTYVTDNLYVDNDTGAFAYRVANEASAYLQEAATHRWYTVASGSAGAAATLSERMRIDSSGNLLVGTTSTTVGAGGSGVTGFRVDGSSGIVQAAGSGTIAAIFNRTTSNGSLISYRYNGSEIGNICTEGDDALIIQSGGASGAGILMHPSSGFISPARNSVKVDNAIDLGKSTHRFKDLYLSGGVHLGGTGSANKLDDYEEGTWTPRISSSTGTVMSGSNCTYTKVGRLVTIRFDITNGSGSNTDIIYGLPFTSAGHGAVHWTWNNLGNTEYIGGYTNTGSIQLIKSGSTTSWSFLNAYRAIGFGLYFTD